MAKRKKGVKRQQPTAKQTVVAEHSPLSPWLVDQRVAIGVLLLSAVAYYVFSHMSTGFYQHDEVGHLNNMKSFWYDPNVILGNWAKTGYKLIYAIPSLLGGHFVKIVNCFMAALAGYMSYKVAKQLGSHMAVLAGIVVATQPMFFELSFRNYSEISTAVVLAGAVWAHYSSRLHWSTFLLAYVCTIRQEMLPLLAAYGVILMMRKQWLSILIGSIPILFVNIWGAIKTGDPLYFISSLISKSASLGKEYPRQGFWHYFTTAEAIYGGIALVLFFSYLATRRWNKNIHWFLLVPILYFFGIHVLFNIQVLDLGPATGGNLRYMTVITPLVSTAGVLGLESLRRLEDRKVPMIVIGILVLITAIFFTYENNSIRLTEARSWTPLIITALAAAAILLPSKGTKDGLVVLLLALVGLISIGASATTFDLTPEEKAIGKAGKYYNKQISMKDGRGGKEIHEDDHVYFDHIVFSYFTDKCRDAFPGPNLRPRKGNAETAEVGSIFIWDTHYSYRPNSHKDLTPEEYFIKQPDRFKKLNEFISTDRRFKMVMYKKIKQ